MAYQKDRRIGDLSVFKAFRVLTQHGLKPTIKDEKGFDIQLGDGRKVEVKFDTWIITTGNVSAEWWVDEDKQVPGWTQYSDADILLYFYSLDWAYVMSMPRLQSYIRSNFDRLEKKYYNAKRDGITYGNVLTRKTLNIMVPIATIPEVRMREIEEMFDTPEKPVIVRRDYIEEDMAKILLEQESVKKRQV